ncbi:hypothetical protein BCR33DRAFT_721540 [Rhizoclosmatium globosum]|uniref:SAGA-associated factor 11 n=1 Tax=Rhizoclosmatium globosum TaxID=329046 RepID=A0A1Y2BR05_9FUNG|nr:hypothetical protein BCR33DRAFT_721540 [Rhizoclosmatium globosum]|eukprot:ORY37176.1 hypothetical protein BCR33DRAFT_721540 [Rhizoclosmatium globosum]
MTAILSSDQVVLVTCKVCSKPVLHSSLLAHLGTCLLQLLPILTYNNTYRQLSTNKPNRGTIPN